MHAALTFPLRQKLDQLVSGRLFGVLIVLLQSRADYCGGLVIARNLRGEGKRKIKETPALLDFRLMISRAHIVSGGSDSDDYHYGTIADKTRGWKCSVPQIILAQSILSASAAAAVKRHRVARVPTRMLRYRFPSCRSIRILMMRMSGPEPWTLPAGLLPQEAERRCDFVGVVGLKVAGVESLVGGDVSTSRQDTDGDLICWDGHKKNQEGDCCSEL